MKHLKQIFIFIIILKTPKLAISQANDEDKFFFRRFFNSYDSSYIEKTSKDFIITLNSKNWMDAYQLKIEDETLSLQSSLCYNVGMSIRYKMFSLGYSVNINDLALPGSKIKRNEFNLNLANNMISLEMSFYNNKGQTNITEYRNNTTTLNFNESFDGLNTKIYGADLYYFVNNKKYSNAYVNSNKFRQIKSVGSMIIGLSFSYESINFDFSRLPEQEQLETLTKKNIIKHTYNTYSLSVGYGYNFVFSNRWTANITIIPSVGASVESNENDFTLKNKSRIAVIQDLDKFFWGLNCQYNTHWYYTNENSISNSIGNFNLFFGMRL